MKEANANFRSGSPEINAQGDYECRGIGEIFGIPN